MPNFSDSHVPLGGGFCPCPHFVDEEIGLERGSHLLESGRTQILTQVLNSEVCAPNFYGLPGCLQQDLPSCATSTWIGPISLGLGWVLSAKELLVGYPVGSSHLACGLEPVIKTVLGSTGHVCPRHPGYSMGAVRRDQAGGPGSLGLPTFPASPSPQTVLQVGGKVPREENSCAGCGLHKPFLLWALVFVPVSWEVGLGNLQAFSAFEVEQILDGGRGGGPNAS